MAAKKTRTRTVRRLEEDLNLNHIVNAQFDNAAQHLKLQDGLLSQIKSCNNVYYMQFPIKLGKQYVNINAWRAEHSHQSVALEVDPRPFVVGICFGASACFATPLGYQTNLMVYGPGGYRFTDYARLGAPLVLAVLLILPFLVA